MNLLQKLFGGTSAKPEKRYYTLTVKCLRCGETLDGRVDLDNDPSVEYEEGGEVYYARKVLMGDGMCFQRVEVTCKFTPARTLIEQQITGGEFIQ
ncbi:MAG: hypothetical protein Q8L41_03245 [Anaerolineales bacterium]|nr:hypothetical protein [Anaerolineales bacterium]MDP2777446.1 hypothetical protein [Anaerolineales bacterium]